jgi:hypothetical protein
MSRLAIDTAVARLDGNDAGERETVIPPQLIVRGTTCRVAAAPSSNRPPHEQRMTVGN